MGIVEGGVSVGIGSRRARWGLFVKKEVCERTGRPEEVWKGQKGFRLSEIGEFDVHGIEVWITQAEYGVLFFYFAFGHTLAVEKAQAKRLL